MSLTNNRISNNQNITNQNITNNVYNVVDELQDYMFTGKNLTRFNKNNFGILQTNNNNNNNNNQKDKSIFTNVPIKEKLVPIKEKFVPVKPIVKNDDIYKPFQTDSLFWCFYILKYGFSKYEMEIGNQHFPIEKAEKFKYIELLRKNKSILKINKIKPLSDLEDDLANNPRISIKTFFALCIVENINILLVNKRKIYESITNDNPKINVIHRNSVSFEHYIELNVSDDKLSNFRDTYYKVQGFETGLKSMSAYKVDELLELCKKLDINVVNKEEGKKKMTKKDIYELLLLKI